ncbi:MAG: CHAT domain-containing protein, partial [Ignavibacteriae bacterium]|nr:CHAT domain-containing protein [Ignavibacteriota bacterium]
GIPFEFLCTGKKNNTVTNFYASQKYLIEDYPISYSPSFSIWKELKERSISDKTTALLVGDPTFQSNNNEYAESRGLKELDLYSRDIKMLPLRYSAKEIEDIEGYFGDDVVLLGREATESNFKKNSSYSSIIHISTHSFLFKNNPVIIFGGDEDNDGYLETGEVAGLKLESDLVVLSSCKSGLGEENNAEGILGMQKAFFDAGASSILLSLWDVSDKQTSIFMKFFYEFLSENIDKSEALRKAKIKFINEVDPNPYYWAAFTLSGNSNSIFIEKKSFRGYYLFLSLSIVLISYILFRKRNIFIKMQKSGKT